MRELKLRGLARRTLVVAPKGLVTQWVSEMRLHFNEEFHLILPEDLAALRRLLPVQSPEFKVQSQEEQLGTRSSGP